MKRSTCITTSWDDGHPLDLRVADLLAKYGLRGTFYVPRTAENATMTVEQVRELSQSFEVGAHTLHHVVLTGAGEQEARREIADSRSWIEDSTGQPCPMFCPPRGKFSARHLRLIREASYGGSRNVELLSLDFPRQQDGLMLMPTTVQAHPHGLLAYVRNVLRRAAVGNLWLYLAHGRSTDWARLARSLLERALASGGVLHLWGHSWEVEQTGQWQRLEEVLRFLGQFTSRAPALTNWQVCQAAQAGGAVP
jgi:peptidoglycan/xylan/chitin deacetylase (PgdA/CDA1 family)